MKLFELEASGEFYIFSLKKITFYIKMHGKRNESRVFR